MVFGPHPDGLERTPLTVGAAHPAVDLRLVRDGVEVMDEGVLEMRCPALMNGYHKLPDVTRKAMTPDGYYITGDVFRRDADGFFYFVGRADDMFVCGGENIYPSEVEKMLERHPAVHQACVVPVPDELKAHKPVAFIVPRAGRAWSARRRSSSLPWPMRRLTSIRGACGSSTNCRSPAPTRSIASAWRNRP